MRTIKRFLIILFLSVLFPVISINTSYSEISVPKVGECLNLNSGQYNASNYEGGYVNCSEMHNFEVYRVILWPTISDPNTVSDNNRRIITNNLCMPWQGNAKYLNDWGYFTPSAVQWSAGMGSVVCIAGVKRSETKSFDFYSWKGSVLDVG